MKFKIWFVFVFLVFENIFFAKDVNKLDIDGYISLQKVYKGNYYFMDKKNNIVYQYSKSSKLLNTFGKSGEGPGELRRISGFDFTDGQIYMQSESKIVFFSLNKRNLLKEIKKVRPSYFFVLNNGKLLEIVREYNVDNKPDLMADSLYLCSSGFKRLKLLLKDSEMNKPGMFFRDFINTMEIKYSSEKGEIIVSQRKKGFLFHVFNDDGDLIFKIKKNETKRLRVSEKFKNDFKEELLSDPRMRSNLEMAKQLMKKIKFSEYFPTFHSFYLDEKGDIFIRTYQRKRELLLYEKYSPEGKFIRNFWIEDENSDVFETRNYISFYKNQFIYLKESPDGDYILVKQSIK